MIKYIINESSLKITAIEMLFLGSRSSHLRKDIVVNAFFYKFHKNVLDNVFLKTLLAKC